MLLNHYAPQVKEFALFIDELDSFRLAQNGNQLDQQASYKGAAFAIQDHNLYVISSKAYESIHSQACFTQSRLSL